MPINSGIQWVRQPLPMALDHINVWLLNGDSSFSIVDTGINFEASRKIWKSCINEHAAGNPLDKVVGTHLHPDHIGLAGWLCEEYRSSLWMTREEYLLCRLLCEDTGKPAPPEGILFYQAAGLGSSSLDRYQKSFGQFGRAVSALPQNYNRLRHNDHLELSGSKWQVLVGSGHSPEHACLFNETDNILISGDQILPTITSIVAVWPTEPEANPLENWINSCRELKDWFPSDVLVLPSHGKPFRGAHDRLDYLVSYHLRKLEQLHAHCKTPCRAVDVFSVLFNSKISESNEIMAVGEATAHFNYLRRQNQMVRTTDKDGVHWYRSV